MRITQRCFYDGGWNKLPDTIFANQKRLGVIPQDAQLTPWPSNLLKSWDDLTPVEKKLFIRRSYERPFRRCAVVPADKDDQSVIQFAHVIDRLDDPTKLMVDIHQVSRVDVGLSNENCSLINGIILPPENQMKFYEHGGDEYTYPHAASCGSAFAFFT